MLRSLIDAIRNGERSKTNPYDTTATVRRVENGIAWVHIPGGVDETPVKLTIAAEAGDEVQVRVSGGRAFLVGNSTAPPTDDKTAKKAISIANSAKKQVNIFKTAIEQGDFDGADGANGKGVIAVVIEHCLASARTIPEGGTFEDIQTTDWSEDTPEYQANSFYWMRIVTYYDDDSITYGDPQFDMSGQAVAEATIAVSEARAAARTAESIASGALAAASTRRRVFNSTPTPPYDVNDLWFDGVHGKTYLCSTAKADGATYSASDWTLYSTDVSDHFWWDSAGAHVAENAGDLTTGASQTISSSGTVMMRDGKIVTSWTGSNYSSAALNFYDCSHSTPNSNDLIASYARSGISQYINNILAMALTASGLSYYSPDANHYLEAVFGPSGTELYAENKLAMKLAADIMKFFASDGTTEIASFGASGSRVGKLADSHMDITAKAIAATADDGQEYFRLENMGGNTVTNSYDYTASEIEDLWESGSVLFVPVDKAASITSVLANGTRLSTNDYDFYPSSHQIAILDISGYTTSGVTITVTALLETDAGKAFTFGTRGTGAKGPGSVSFGDANNVNKQAYAFGKGIDTGYPTVSEFGLFAGKYNKANEYNYFGNRDYLLVLGNGTSNSARKNVYTVDKAGNIEMAGGIKAGGEVIGNRCFGQIVCQNATIKSTSNVNLAAGSGTFSVVAKGAYIADSGKYLTIGKTGYYRICVSGYWNAVGESYNLSATPPIVPKNVRWIGAGRISGSTVYELRMTGGRDATFEKRSEEFVAHLSEGANVSLIARDESGGTATVGNAELIIEPLWLD